MIPTDDGDQDWGAYYVKTGQRPPRVTLCFALDRFAAAPPAESELLAVDLGCGNGRDTIEMLRRGWSVVAIDAEPAALEGLQTRADLPASAALTTQLGHFEDLQWPAAPILIPTDDGDQDWGAYYVKTGQRPPRVTLCFALDRFAAAPPAESELLAVDLGCGNGRDTIEMLRRGWSVVAIDAEPAALEGLQTRADLPASAALTTQLGHFEDLQWPAAHLVNASFSLPLCPAAKFNVLWQCIVNSLLPGGHKGREKLALRK